MPLDTTKSVKSITYNGTTIPLYAKPEQTKTVDLSMASGNQVVSPDGGEVLSSVTINKPSTLVAENIKKDVNIGGVVGTLESGTSSKIQPSKNLTITSNGTTTITPDAPYDAMGQVGVTVNVAGVDMCSLTIKSSGPVIGAPRVWYFDGENTAQVAAYKTPVQVVKNSIIFSNEIFQNTTMLTDVGNGGDGRYAYQITGDCVATVGF